MGKARHRIRDNASKRLAHYGEGGASQMLTVGQNQGSQYLNQIIL